MMDFGTRLRREPPAIVLEIVESGAFFSLDHRDADVALRPARSAPEGLWGRRLARVATAPYATPAYLAEAGGRALATHDWLGFEPTLDHLASATWLRANVTPERVVLRANRLAALQAAARAGMGVALLPCYAGDVDPRLVRVSAPSSAWETALWLLTHPDLRNVPRIRAVLDGLAAFVHTHRATIEGAGRTDLRR